MTLENATEVGVETPVDRRECRSRLPRPWTVSGRVCQPTADGSRERRVRAATAASYRAKRSIELLRLWHQAARHLADRGPDFDQFWDELVAALQPKLFGQLRRIYRPDPLDCLDREEVVQEVFLRLLKRNGHVMRQCSATNDSQLQSYLKRICETCLTDLIRHRRAKKRGYELTVRFSNHDDKWVPDASQDLEHWIICRSELAGFGKAIRRCSLRSRFNAQRNCWILAEALGQGRNSSELAGQLGLRPSTVDSVVSRMRQDLRGEGWDIAPRSP